MQTHSHKYCTCGKRLAKCTRPAKRSLHSSSLIWALRWSACASFRPSCSTSVLCCGSGSEKAQTSTGILSSMCWLLLSFWVGKKGPAVFHRDFWNLKIPHTFRKDHRALIFSCRLANSRTRPTSHLSAKHLFCTTDQKIKPSPGGVKAEPAFTEIRERSKV